MEDDAECMAAAGANAAYPVAQVNPVKSLVGVQGFEPWTRRLRVCVERSSIKGHFDNFPLRSRIGSERKSGNVET